MKNLLIQIENQEKQPNRSIDTKPPNSKKILRTKTSNLKKVLIKNC